MKHLKEYKLFENTDRLKELCEENLTSLLDNSFYYYIDTGDSPEHIRIELYKNSIVDDFDPVFYWDDIKEEYEVFIEMLTEYNYVIDEILVQYDSGGDNITSDFLNLKINEDEFIHEIRMYIKK